MATRPDPARCRRAKTAIAREIGNIQGMTERYLAESHDYFITKIPQRTYDNSAGEDPITNVRYSTAPIEEREYVEILVQGAEDGTMPARGCNGQEEDFDVGGINRRGAYGCNMPGQTLHGGYDVFGRVLTGKAYETDVMCALDLITQEHVQAYIAMLRRDLPKRAVEQFGYSLERQIIDYARYNTSCVNGFVHQAGAFPAAPLGTLDLGVVRRVFQIMEAQGWTGAREVTTSHAAFEVMRMQYKLNTGLELQSSLVSSETQYLDADTQVVDWAGIRWILKKTPTRGWLRETNEGLEFVPVRPIKARAGTGGGVVADVNEDYFECFTYCDGERHELYELGFYIHDKACFREAFAVPQVGDKRFSNMLFNFEVRMIDGAYIDCNEDNLKWFFRMLHAYGFQSHNPELMGSVIYRVQPDIIYVNTPTCVRPEAGTPVVMAPAQPQQHNECSYSDLTSDCSNDLAQAVLPEPSASEDVDPSAGNLRFLNSAIVTETDAGTLKVWVERIGGVEGAASVSLTTADGTAADGTDFTDPGAEVLSWADGEAGRKAYEIAIDPDGAGEKSFTVVKGAVVGATWVGATSATVTIDTAFDELP